MDADRALRLAGMALRARRLEVGYESAAALAQSGRARLVLAASDASGRVVEHARAAADECGAKFIHAPFDKFALGRALGRAECAAAATADAGFAKAIAEALETGGNTTRR